MMMMMMILVVVNNFKFTRWHFLWTEMVWVGSYLTTEVNSTPLQYTVLCPLSHPMPHATVNLSFRKSQASLEWNKKTSTYINLFFYLSVCDCVVLWCPYIKPCFLLICIQPWFVLSWGLILEKGFFFKMPFLKWWTYTVLIGLKAKMGVNVVFLIVYKYECFV